MAHIHAENMKLYAEDAAMSDTPWEKWEFCLYGIWKKCIQHPVWGEEIQYRQIRIKDSIDWTHVAPQYNWMARDFCGDVFLFTNKPAKHGIVWNITGGAAVKAAPFASYQKGNVPWTDSLVSRY